MPARVGPWRLLEPIGRGGDAVVYRAVREDGTPAAVKTLHAPDPARLSALRREIHALARVFHPGVVRILEHGVDRGLPWYAMELIEGPTLMVWARARWQPDGRPIPAGTLVDLLTVIRRVCDPLAWLHGEGLVHRDLKPGNIIVREGDTPVLVDFGLVAWFGGASSREALEPGGEVVGTYAFMAPEQVRGELVDARADLFAIGAVLYALLTGRPAFSRVEDLLEPGGAPEPPSRYVPGLPLELETLVLRLLTRAPAGRPGYADDVARALEALGARSQGSGPCPRDYLYRPGFAGRDRLLATVGRHFSSRLGERAGALVMVGGGSGYGKTRLALEVAGKLRSRGIPTLTGEGMPAAGGQGAGAGGGPFHLFRPLMQRFADRWRTDGSASTVPGRRVGLLAPYEPSIDGLPALPVPPDLEGFPPAEARRMLFGGLLEATVWLMGGAPLLLVLDDLQWADALSLEFLESLGQTPVLGRLPLLVLGLFRTEEVSPALRRVLALPGSLSLEMDRLSEAEVRVMVGDMLALPDPPAPLVRGLVRSGEGVPFFVSEYLRTAVAESMLRRDGLGRWTVAAEAGAGWGALPLPRSIQALVARRLAGISSGASRLLSAASVLGRELEGRLLTAVAGFQEADAHAALHELLSRGVLEEPSPDDFRFVHDQIREVAYGGLEPEVRASLHRAAAEGLERSTIGGEPPWSVLAQHWERAGVTDQARRCFLTAARLAETRYAHAEAERCYGAWLQLEGSRPDEALEVRRELAEVLERQGRTQEALAEQARVLEAARAQGDSRLEGAGLHALARIHALTASFDQALHYAGEALELARRLGDRRAEGLAGCVIGHVNQEQGRSNVALERFTRAVELLREVGDRRGELEPLGRLAGIHWLEGRLDEARRLCEGLLEAAREIGDRHCEATTLNRLGLLHWSLSEFATARACYEASLALAREIGDRRTEGIILGQLGGVCLYQGRLEEAVSHCEQAILIHREVGNRRSEGETRSNLAAALHQLGRLEEAERGMLEALRLHRQIANRRFEGAVQGWLGALRIDQGRFEEARALLDASEAVLEAVGDRLHRGETLLARARLARQADGWLEEAARLACEALALFEAMRNRAGEVRALCELGQVSIAGGRSAAPWIEAAESRLRGTGHEPQSAPWQALERLRAVEASRPR